MIFITALASKLTGDVITASQGFQDAVEAT